MAITVQRAPAAFSPIYNQLVYIVSSTNTAQDNFFIRAYVDVWNGSSYVEQYTEKIYPKPGTIYADFPIDSVLKSFASADLANLFSIPTSGANGSHGLTYRVRFREWYGTPPSAQGSEVNDAGKSAWNASLRRRVFATFDYQDWVINATKNARFLTPVDTIPIRLGDSFLLSFASEVAVRLQVSYFDSAGGSLGTANITLNDSTAALVARFQSVGVGPGDLTSWPVGVSYYTVFAETSGDALRSQTLTFTVDRSCSVYGIERLFWLNSYGGIDAYNFPLISRQEVDIDRRTYNQVVGESNSSYEWVLNTYDAERLTYATNLRYKLTVNTGYLDDVESVYLRDLISSPVILWYDGTEFVRMFLDKNSYEIAKQENNALIQVALTLYESLEDIRQRG